MCYSEWFRREKELEQLEQAHRQAEELRRRVLKPGPAGGQAPAQESKPAEKPEPAAV